MRKDRRRIARKWLPLGLLTVAVVGAPLMIFSRDGLPRLRAVERELVGVESENAQLEREIGTLLVEVVLNQCSEFIPVPDHHGRFGQLLQ